MRGSKFILLISLATQIWATPTWGLSDKEDSQAKILLQEVLGIQEKSSGKSLLQKIKDHGLDPDQLQLGWDQAEVDERTFILKYQGWIVGRLLLERALLTEREGALIVGRVDVESEYRGRGLGTLLHLGTAAYLESESGEKLFMSALNTSDSDRVWEKLLKEGWARKEENGVSIHLGLGGCGQSLSKSSDPHS